MFLLLLGARRVSPSLSWNNTWSPKDIKERVETRRKKGRDEKKQEKKNSGQSKTKGSVAIFSVEPHWKLSYAPGGRVGPGRVHLLSRSINGSPPAKQKRKKSNESSTTTTRESELSTRSTSYFHPLPSCWPLHSLSMAAISNAAYEFEQIKLKQWLIGNNQSDRAHFISFSLSLSLIKYL